MAVSLYNAATVQGEVLSLLIQAKGLECSSYDERSPYAKESTHEPTLVDNGHVIHGAMVISLYLEQRYPSPSLLPQDPEQASIVMMLYRQILKSGRASLDLGTYKMHLAAHGYITGQRPSFVDIAISALAPEGDPFWERYRARLEESWGSWEDTKSL